MDATSCAQGPRSDSRTALPVSVSPVPTYTGRMWASYGLCALIGAAVVWAGSLPLAIVYNLACRFTYMFFVGSTLRRRDRREGPESLVQADAAFRKFEWKAAVVVNNDAIGVVCLCLATRNSFEVPWGSWALVALGTVLIVGGLVIRLWAAATLGFTNYFWKDFFLPPDFKGDGCRKGPYRFLKDPMYTVGYLPGWGVAMVLFSWPGLIGMAVEHLSIFVFVRLVELPHVRRLYGPAKKKEPARAPVSPPRAAPRPMEDEPPPQSVEAPVA